MNTNTITRNTNQRGYTLMEILVAVSIFAIIILAALLLYDRSNQVFKQSVESTDMQQSTRVAFDKLAADLRMAGFDYDRDGTPFSALASTWKPKTAYTAGMLVQPTNPNGHTYVCINGGTSDITEPVWPTVDNDQVGETGGSTVKWQEKGQLQYQQPDEQIEYAGRSAVVLRANFNYSTATGQCTSLAPCEGGREPKLESAEFPIVTIANNEIVAYALKPAKFAAGETADDLVFYADVAIPRKANPSTDGKESKITISGVDLCDKGCNSPPYTLYRYTIQDNGQPDAGTPVAENIRDLSLRYFTTTSAATADEITALPNGDGMYDGGNPDATVAGRDTRSTIRAVELTLTGMNPQPDYNYTNPSDTIAKNYRTLELKSLITPRNAGRRGMKEYNTEAPGTPEIKSVCAGACNGVLLTWSAPTTGGDIESYAVLYDTDPCQGGGDMPLGGFQFSEEVGLNLSGSVGRYITPNTNYSFAVQAISKWGAKTSKCVGPVKAINKTKPAALKELIATNTTNPAPYQAVANQIDLYFPPAISNVSGQDVLSCTGGGNVQQTEMPPAEKRYYEIWRGTTLTFQPADPGTTRILEAGSTIQPAQVGDYMKFSDVTAANCTNYYYRIRVVDYCERNPTWNETGSATQGQSDWYPALGSNAIGGYANANAEPKKPTLSLAKADCVGVNCQLTFTWPAITQNVKDETIAVDKYILRVYQSSDGGATFPTAVTDTKNVLGGALTYTYDFKATNPAQFKLVAVDCAESAPSDAVIYPCVFSGGILTAGLSAGSYGGTGTNVDPYIIEGATATASTTLASKEFRISIIDTVTGGEFASATKAGPATSASFAIPNTPDGHLMHVLITAVDDKGCSRSTDFYASDTAAPACSITDSGTDASIVTVNKGDVVYKLKNTSANALTIKKIVVTLNKAVGKALPAVAFNGTVVNTNCTLSTMVITAPANSVVPANSSTYLLKLDYQDNNLAGVNPTQKLCIIYQVPSGDILSCQIAPGAATCTEPGSTCQ